MTCSSNARLRHCVIPLVIPSFGFSSLSLLSSLQFRPAYAVIGSRFASRTRPALRRHDGLQERRTLVRNSSPQKRHSRIWPLRNANISSDRSWKPRVPNRLLNCARTLGHFLKRRQSYSLEHDQELDRHVGQRLGKGNYSDRVGNRDVKSL